MRNATSVEMALSVVLVTAAVCGSAGTAAETTAVDFDSEIWVVEAGRIVEMGGRRCLIGAGHLEGVEFTDGVIEVDVWMAERRRSYPSGRDGGTVRTRDHRRHQIGLER
jgi:hypothetical protein